MHSSRELRSSSFEITVGGRAVPLVELFDGFGERDRLGVVIRRPCGGVGASALITATITAFYDVHRARGPDFFVYPDYFLFHIGRLHGDHARLDIWPSRKEVVVPEDPARVLEAINDRAVTRLVVEGSAPVVTQTRCPAVAYALIALESSARSTRLARSMPAAEQTRARSGSTRALSSVLGARTRGAPARRAAPPCGAPPAPPRRVRRPPPR
jgi:hypothetical protein